MIVFQNTKYYSCTDIANGCERRLKEFEDLHKKICDVYNKSFTDFIYGSYIQDKLYPAAERKLIRYLEVQKKASKVKVFSIQDVMNFLDRPEATIIQAQALKDKQITIHEVEVV